MMEMQENNQPLQPAFIAGGRELAFAGGCLILGLLLCNFTLFGGFNLGFAIGVVLCILLSVGYLLSRGCKLKGYGAVLLAISLVIGAGFARSDDGFVKFVMVQFLFVGVNLGLTQLAGKQRHSAAGFSSLCDCFYTGFCHSFGFLTPTFSGLKQALPRQSKAFGKLWGILVGLLLALPLVALVATLLMNADAAFEGLMSQLPELDLEELPGTLIFGGLFASLLCAQGISLAHKPVGQPFAQPRKGIREATVNTVLVSVCLVYGLYFVSQLAYLTGGLAGILPEGYTMAQYARRGFFEMAVLCGINLALIALCVGLVRKTDRTPLATRLLCLFLGAVNIFLVAAASGKMFLYMEAYGLTRLRLLTQVIMLWLGLCTLAVAAWLLLPRLPYMKLIVVTGLVIGAVVLWADVDNTVAGYNVDRYLQGHMEAVDIRYLSGLNHSAVPHIARLAQEAPEESVRREARELLDSSYWQWDEDFRGWNYARALAWNTDLSD